MDLFFYTSITMIVGFALIYNGYVKKQDVELKKKSIELEGKKIELEMKKLDLGKEVHEQSETH